MPLDFGMLWSKEFQYDFKGLVCCQFPFLKKIHCRTLAKGSASYISEISRKLVIINFCLAFPRNYYSNKVHLFLSFKNLIGSLENVALMKTLILLESVACFLLPIFFFSSVKWLLWGGKTCNKNFA